MDLLLQTGLPHQSAAVDAVADVFREVRTWEPKRPWENPEVDVRDPRINRAVTEFRQAHPETGAPPFVPAADRGFLNLDVRMETGTGKTYVYAKTMFELHRRLGVSKFILVVPSLAIKAGAGDFLCDPYVQRHFADACGYGTRLDALVLSAPKGAAKGRTWFPSAVAEFVKGSTRQGGTLHVLVVNMQLLTSGKLLSRSDYDFGVEGFYRPLDALAATRPFVILDEPHRFAQGQKAMEAVERELRPQCVIRYGATFPERTTGRGRARRTLRDYQNLVFDLNACSAFNQGLVKGVAKEHLQPISGTEAKVKILRTEARRSVTLRLKERDRPDRTFELGPGDSLSTVHEGLSGVSVVGVTRSGAEFSNGAAKSVGEELDVDVFLSSYQEQMLRLAIQRHFETERENFGRDGTKIKTLALFFIDDIASFRGDAPWLRDAFDRLVRDEIGRILPTLRADEGEWRSFLEATLADVPGSRAGYFAQDNADTDEAVSREAELILRGKKDLVSLRKPDGSWNTTRFLFSKWTLKEGWDNPNVFTICKLRSSGSETSKLQEVGRGLRLPVDEAGNRISNETFYLNYIVDFTEADFAEKLVREINAETAVGPVELPLAAIRAAAAKRGKTENELFVEMLQAGWIDIDRNVPASKRDAFFEAYPEFEPGLAPGRIRDRNAQTPRPIRIRKARFEELRALWEAVNRRRLLFFDPELDAGMEDVCAEIFRTDGLFADATIGSFRERVGAVDGSVDIVRETGVQYLVHKPMGYGPFLLSVSKVTNLPVGCLDRAFHRVFATPGTLPDPSRFNRETAARFCDRFAEWKRATLQGRFRYRKSAAGSAGETALTNADGTPKESIVQGRIGTRLAEGTPCAKYLYDAFAYDSPLELDNIRSEISEVVVYGKIPRRSIAIPVVTGETYSPDFLYVVRRADGSQELNVVVETKDVDTDSDLRGTERERIACAKVFFKNLEEEGFPVVFRTQLKNDRMRQLLEQVLSANQS